MPALIMRDAMGESVSICRHQATVSRSRSSSGDDVFHQAPVESLRHVVCPAEEPRFLGPLRPDGAGRGSTIRILPSKLPTFGPVSPNPQALFAAMEMSQTRCRMCPPADGVSRHHGDDQLGMRHMRIWR